MKLGEPLRIDSDGGDVIGKRDAVHVAVVSCQWDEDFPGALSPGAPVRFTGDAYSQVRLANSGEQPHGVVDPFVDPEVLKAAIFSGDCFLVILYPGMTTSVRHDYAMNIPEDDEHFKHGQWDCRSCN